MTTDDQICAAFVVSTKGRTAELDTLFQSLANQDFKNFEVIIVDQNSDNRLEVIYERWRLILNLRWIRTPTERGLSRGRNIGWSETQCPVVLFPDDDCWYPPSVLSRVLSLFETTKADIVCGRAADKVGRDINGRFESSPQWVTLKNVWTTQIEWMVGFRLSALRQVGGYDPAIGVGASTPWQACEGQDIVLRALAQGLRCYFDNSLYGHHSELNIYNPDEEMCRKGRMYGRGLGHVLRIHKYGYGSLFNWLVRPMVRAVLALFVGRVDRFRYYREVMVGRWEGWTQTSVSGLKKPKILFNLPSQYAAQPSGVATFAFQLLENLIGRSEFTYILRSPWSRQQLPEGLRAKTFEMVTIPRPRFLLLNILWQGLVVRRFCHRRGIELVVNLDPYGSPTGGVARLLIVHDLYFRTIPDHVRRNVALTNDIIFRLMLASDSEIVTVSDSTKRDLEHWYPQARGRTTTIHSATSLNSISARAGSEIEKPYILTVGNATANKNFSVLASALASVHLVLPDIVAVHVGADPKETIVSKLKELASPVRVLRFQGISDQKLASLYRHASCLCIPSLYEGFCLPILEAQVLGCPVICSNRPALPEIAGAGALLFDPTDADALAKALLTVLQNPAKSEALTRAGHENALGFSWDLAARQYEAVFRRLIENGH
jgi:glycosyltransferase involved in cell wall biosynthesis